MPRILAVAYDVDPRSPAQPRVAALLHALRRRGAEVSLWTEHEPGPWAARLDVMTMPDPVLGFYRKLLAKRGGIEAGEAPVVAAKLSEAASRVAEADPEGDEERDGEGRLWRVGRRVQQAMLFPDNQVVWARRVGRRMRRAARRGDVVITFSRPESAGLIGAACQRAGAAWWSDYADGWCYRGLRSEAMREGPRRARELELERRWVGSADGVSTVNRDLADWFRGLRGDADVVEFPNLIPEELLLDAPAPPAPPAEHEPLVLGYFGRLASSDPQRSLEPLLRLLGVAGADRRVCFRFYGDYLAGDLASIQELRGRGFDVEVHDPVARRALCEIRDQVHAAFVISSPAQRGSSSKLLDNFGLGLPVFAMVPADGLAAAMVRDAGLGEVFDPGAGVGDAAAWNAFVAGVRAGRYRVDPAARAPYTSAVLVPPVVERIESLLGDPSAATAHGERAGP